MGKYCGQVAKYKNVQRSKLVKIPNGWARYLTSYELDEWFENMERIKNIRRPIIKENHYEENNLLSSTVGSDSSIS